MSKIVSFLKDESGASAAEYVLIIAVMGVLIASGATALGSSLNQAMTKIGTYITGKTALLS